MENTKTLHALDEFAKAKPKDIPKELEEYIRFVAMSGDPVYQWSLVKFVFRQKLLNVIMEFYESSPMMDVPLSSNFDSFNFDIIKKRLLERYDRFSGVPFTIQRIAELLVTPRKLYSRVDKFMRALEKNIWVVSTREAVLQETEQTNIVNGVFPAILHPNSLDSNQERLQRQTQLFDHDQNRDLSCESEAKKETDEKDYPKGKDLSFEVSQDTANADRQIEEQSVTNKEQEQQSYDQESNSTEANCDAPDKVPEILETKEEDTAVNDAESETSESISQDKTEEITVTEIEGSDGSEIAGEPIEPAYIVEPTVDEQEEEEATAPVTDEKVDLKRKIEEVDNEHEVLTCKRLETEPPIEVQASKVDEDAAAPAAELVEPVKIAAENKDKTVEKVVVKEVLENTEVEGAMDSAEVEEKAEMLVEEPEQAMEVDEASGSEQSPMLQEDVVLAEPMEEVEPSS